MAHVAGVEDLPADSRHLVASQSRSFRDNDLMAGLSDVAYEEIEKKISVLEYAPDEVIFEEDGPGDSLYLIAEGSVKISKRGRGGQQETLTYLMERDFFGEMALVDNGKRSASATAARQTILGRIEREGWNLLLQLSPNEVLSNFTRAVTKRLRNNNQHFIEEMMRNERLSLIGTTVSSIVHDMNNPIGCILGACEALRTQIQNEFANKMTAIIRDSVDTMMTMTTELVDFSRGKMQLNLKSLCAPDLVQGLETEFAKCRQGMDVKIEVLYEGVLRVDKHRMVRVFGNLIRNAREAARKDGPNSLRFRVQRIDSNVRFEISDTGVGIPAALLPRIFEPFMTHGKSNGTGLGLAISKTIVDAHHGSISVKSGGGGTSFRIELPVEPADSLPTPSTP